MIKSDINVKYLWNMFSLIAVTRKFMKLYRFVFKL